MTSTAERNGQSTNRRSIGWMDGCACHGFVCAPEGRSTLLNAQKSPRTTFDIAYGYDIGP
eukprot:scaffold98721_cov17-Prasinocladus_malaysianus.AAC.1